MLIKNPILRKNICKVKTLIKTFGSFFSIVQMYHWFSNNTIILYVKYVKRIKMVGEYLFMRVVCLIFAW